MEEYFYQYVTTIAIASNSTVSLTTPLIAAKYKGEVAVLTTVNTGLTKTISRKFFVQNDVVFAKCVFVLFRYILLASHRINLEVVAKINVFLVLTCS